MKQRNCIAKEFFAIKTNCSITYATKRIKQILHTEYKQINQKTIIISLN